MVLLWGHSRSESLCHLILFQRLPCHPSKSFVFIKHCYIELRTYNTFNDTLMHKANNEKLQQRILFPAFVLVWDWHGKQFSCLAFWPGARNSSWHIWDFLFCEIKMKMLSIFTKHFLSCKLKKKVIGSWFFYSYRTCYSVCQAVKQA